MVRRIFVEKKLGYDTEAQALKGELINNLGISSILELRVFNRYDVSGLGEADFNKSVGAVFSEPQLDYVYHEELPNLAETFLFGYEYLPGQYDQRSDSAVQCIGLLGIDAKPIVRFARMIAISSREGLSEAERKQIKNYTINPVDSKEADLTKPQSLELVAKRPRKVEIIGKFCKFSDEEMVDFHSKNGFAMSIDDIYFVRDYFKKENRPPSITELKVIDTYWSDHCRHTTFNTKLTDIEFPDTPYGAILEAAFSKYKQIRKEYYQEKAKGRAISLMDLGTICAKYLRKNGQLEDLDISEEINACSIKIRPEIVREGKAQSEDWILMFKNETHNHPTEIEPFGGAATCLGGAIRDPLSGRSYVYQAMRVTGAADPRQAFDKTLKGKLSQYQITKGATKGYSSYGNQIGLATGLVDEIYHEDYTAKRMEIGAVLGAAPAHAIKRERPAPGDAVLLIGGQTGRDGIGGATGSSKEHDETSTATAGAEVQKGNPLVERGLQRLFSREVVATLIKRCNDFGAGGVCVAIGELADSLDIDLSLVPKKYDGLDGTELAISESQERMAVVVAKEDVEKMIGFGLEENLEVTQVASITDSGRVRMYWDGECILDLKREFLDTNGVTQEQSVFVEDMAIPQQNRAEIKDSPQKSSSTNMQTNYGRTASEQSSEYSANSKDDYLNLLSSLNVCSKKGMVDCFDSTIGAASVLLPLGGKSQLTPACGMASKLPLTCGETDAASLMAYGYDPSISTQSPFHGAVFAVLDSVAKLVAMGASYADARLSFQEYFKRLGAEPTRWGEPFSALLGAMTAQLGLGVAAIGGKDSMSGTYLDIDVPPTLVSFAVAMSKASKTLSPEFKNTKSRLVLLKQDLDENGLPDFAKFKHNANRLHSLATEGMIRSIITIGQGGLVAGIIKSALGNGIGCHIDKDGGLDLTQPSYGSFILELSSYVDIEHTLNSIDYIIIGETNDTGSVKVLDVNIGLDEARKAYLNGLETIFPTSTEGEIVKDIQTISTMATNKLTKSSNLLKRARPLVVIPVFPGTNCEVDSKRAFERAGADVETINICNLDSDMLQTSLERLDASIARANIIMLAGGFSGGDEPDGSAKFITAVFKNEKIKMAVTDLIDERDGLVLGICNGFQALIKLGLVPYGKIIETTANNPTLTFNTIGRHMSTIVRTRIATDNSPWLANTNIGDEFLVPISHGEGRFIADDSTINKLIANAQVATQYRGYNPNGSIGAIEGILSPDGRIFGKMGHIERVGENLYRNHPGNYNPQIFEAGVNYFR